MFRRCLGFSFVENKKSGELNSSLAGDLVERPHDGGASDSPSHPGTSTFTIIYNPVVFAARAREQRFLHQ